MAYLKGGTVVDGNIYVEGGLRVKQIIDSSGRNLPHLAGDDSSVPDRLVRFSDTTGGIDKSNILVKSDSGKEGIYAVTGNREVPLVVGTTDRVTVNDVGAASSQADYLYLDAADTVHIMAGGTTSQVSVTSSGVNFHHTAGNIKVGSSGPSFCGMVKNSSGSYSIGGELYSQASSGQIPDIYAYI